MGSALFICTIFFSLFLTACGKHVPKGPLISESLSDENVVLIYMGDPQQIIKGATLNHQHSLSLEQLPSFQQFHLHSVTVFEEFHLEQGMDQANDLENHKEKMKKKNAALEKPIEIKSISSFSLKINAEQTELYLSKDESEENVFTFHKLGEKFELTKFSQFDAKLLHFSELMKEGERQAYSLLVEVQHPYQGRVLISTLFIKKRENEERINEFTEKNFSYLYGPGLKVKWPKAQSERSLDICTQEIFNHKVMTTFHDNMLAWNPFLPLGHKIVSKVKNNFAPYNDLNQSCLFPIVDYRFEKMVTGLTTVASNLYSGEILHGSILLLLANESNDHLAKTVRHEVGHFLGLGHMFDGSPSVMDYEGTTELQEYDVEALSALYETK